MLDQTLAYLRGDRGEEETKPVDVVAILGSLTSDLGDAGREVSLTGATTAVVAGRRLSLKRAFANLIDNALKYGGAAEIAVSTGTGVTISIRDRGPGIAEADIERAFAPFVRLEPSRNLETGGFGLGLAIAQAIIEGHGGTLRLANHPDGGPRRDDRASASGLKHSVTMPQHACSISPLGRNGRRCRLTDQAGVG